METTKTTKTATKTAIKTAILTGKKATDALAAALAPKGKAKAEKTVAEAPKGKAKPQAFAAKAAPMPQGKALVKTPPAKGGLAHYSKLIDLQAADLLSAEGAYRARLVGWDVSEEGIATPAENGHFAAIEHDCIIVPAAAIARIGSAAERKEHMFAHAYGMICVFWLHIGGVYQGMPSYVMPDSIANITAKKRGKKA